MVPELFVFVIILKKNYISCSNYFQSLTLPLFLLRIILNKIADIIVPKTDNIIKT